MVELEMIQLNNKGRINVTSSIDWELIVEGGKCNLIVARMVLDARG
jgi:hypothetical protein